MYPIWEVPSLTPGIVLALIATFHILPSHLSTSAMWFNVYVETKAYRENKPELLEFIKKYSLMILIFSYVFGSLSGVGIWYAATVASPRGISGLIHNYVWGWATEWVFFIIEVTGIFIYYYTLGKVDKKTHLKIGWIFAIAAWTTMIVIVGILAFMLSPGRWAATGRFFDGFFNQTYWPQLLMRTSLMFSIAATYAIVIATRLKNEEVRRFVTRSASVWGIAGLAIGGLLFFFYQKTLPESARTLISLLATPGLKAGMIGSLGLMILYFIFAGMRPLAVRLAPAILAVFVLFAGIWSIERTREMIRKPYVIPEYMYSNQIIAKDIPSKKVSAETSVINEKGILNIYPFTPNELRSFNESNMQEAGHLIALIECSSCHALNRNGLRPLPQMIKRLGIDANTPRQEGISTIDGILSGLGGYPYMPPFVGTDAEKKALAAYLYSISQGR